MPMPSTAQSQGIYRNRYAWEMDHVHAPTRIAGLMAALRRERGWTQARLAAVAGTSQSAIARYESGAATPSLSTSERIVAALGHRLELRAVHEPDRHDVRLAHQMLDLDPTERLESLVAHARLRQAAEVVEP